MRVAAALLLVALVGLGGAAASAPTPLAGGASDMAADDVVRLLEKNDIVTLLYAQSPARAELAALPDVPLRLRALALSDRAALLRFKALEVYLSLAGDAALQSAELKPQHAALAGVYADAIRQLDDLNIFNLPESVRSSTTSRHVIALGDGALPALRPLLERTEEAPYGGSEEASIAAMHHVRYCDLAAALVAAILGEPYVDDPEPAARDRQVEQLRRRIAVQ